MTCWPARSSLTTGGLVGALAWLALLVAAGCVTVKPVVLDQKTQLENQILGTLQRLEDELILASSVRGDRPAPRLSAHEREAVEAMMTREFHRDDVEALKSQRAVGEARSGQLVIRIRPAAEGESKRVQALVEAENRCRLVILQRAIATAPGLSDRDLPELWRVLYRLNRQTARPGEEVQDEDGIWRAVPAPARGSK